jgi:SiaC family regulatory phosphoprotein
MLEKKIISTKGTPEISLNPDGNIKITGRSINCNIPEFYSQIESWIDEYICNPAELTIVDIFLEYFNTSTFKFYYSLLKKIESLKLKDKKFIINWFYEEGDEDILEKGEDISSAICVTFNFIMISDPMIPGPDYLKQRNSIF